MQCLTEEQHHRNRNNQVNLELLHAKMIVYTGGMVQVAKLAHISKSSLHRKMRGETEFTLQEIGRLACVLDLSSEEVFQIFLAGYLSKSA